MSPPDEHHAGLSRRALLGGVGLGTVGGFLGGMAASSRAEPPAAKVVLPAGRPHSTMSQWIASRGKRYFIAHRGSGDVFPEHSMEAYKAAAAWGAACMEISVGMTSDGVLICMHDLTFDRTTDLKGTVARQPSTLLRSAHIVAPQLGPAWSAEPLARVPLFEDVLRAFGGRVILCVEAKADAAYPAMMATVERFSLQDCVMVKSYYTSSRIQQAKDAGYPVFAYLGNAADVTPANVDVLAQRLDPRTDALVLPADDGDRHLSDEAISHAVRSTVPVWVYPVHRRSDAEHHFSRGVQGVITSSLGYVSTQNAVTSKDTWPSGAVASGEMTRDPTSAVWAPTWKPDGSLSLGLQGRQHFLTLGQFSPVAKARGSYTVQFEAAFTQAPGDAASNLTLAFGQVDDRYYEHQLGTSDGYHAILRFDGRLELYQHQAGKTGGLRLSPTVTSPKVAIGHWMRFRLGVTPTTITWQRLDGAQQTVSVKHSAHRGGYLHLGRSATNGAVSLRNFAVA